MFPIATTPTMETKFDIKVEANTIAGQELAIIEAGFHPWEQEGRLRVLHKQVRDKHKHQPYYKSLKDRVKYIVAKKSRSTNGFNIQSEIWSGTNPIDTHQPEQQLPLPLPQQVPHDDHHDVFNKKTMGAPTKECSKQPPYTVTIDNDLIARTLIELANDGIDDVKWDDNFLEHMTAVYGCNK